MDMTQEESGMNILGFVLKCCILFEHQGFGWGGDTRGNFSEDFLSPAEVLTQECSKAGGGNLACREFPELWKLRVNLQEPPGAGGSCKSS